MQTQAQRRCRHAVAPECPQTIHIVYKQAAAPFCGKASGEHLHHIDGQVPAMPLAGTQKAYKHLEVAADTVTHIVWAQGLGAAF